MKCIARLLRFRVLSLLLYGVAATLLLGSLSHAGFDLVVNHSDTSSPVSDSSADVINNHFPVDPVLGGAIVLVKSTPLVNVSVGQLVPYTITATNTLAAELDHIDLLDTLPPGFKYKQGSATLDGAAAEPQANGRVLSWTDLTLAPNGRSELKLLLVVGAGVQPGEYVNSVQAFNNRVPAPGSVVSNPATAAVRVVPDPEFDCSEVIGKVFDDLNANGYQDDGEPPIPNVRLATVHGLLVTTDVDGRFHVTCAKVPNAFRGSNFVMKLDERTLPTGYRLTSENPRTIVLTRGKMGKINFGATFHRIVQLETGDAASKKHPFRISVDGVPLEDSGTIDPDIQRSTDLMLEDANLQVRYGALESTPWLNVSATPNSAARDEKVIFTAYCNYDFWIKRREVRLFAAGASLQTVPLKIIPLDSQARGQWLPEASVPSDIRYVLRVYDEKERFDETAPKALKIDHQAKPQKNQGSGQREEWIGYGENTLQIHNIPAYGGSVTVNGRRLMADSRVSVMGQPVPVAVNGSFAVRQILPPGHHQIDVRISSKPGAMQFTRNLYIPYDDWFYIGIADLVAGANDSSGPARLVTEDTQHYEDDLYIDGRLAFYLKGKIKGRWLLTAAADTQEQPLDRLFSNLDAKDPRSLLRRLDPDRYYPVYGDDSTTVEDAPTLGKFYVKLARDDSHVMWGNFQTRWSGSDFANYNRGMYGANVRWQSTNQTQYGEKRAQADLFAGDPGTLGARDEFRGTGGSLYYLRHLDITQGSERVWVEIRDKDSGIVLQATQLTAGQDYDINTIQGRILLTTPLPSVAQDTQLVRAGSLSGHPLYLVATYEYTPGVTETENMTLGGRASSWLNEHLNIGLSGYQQEDTGGEQTLGEADATLRYAPGTYIKAEIANSDGPGSGSNNSLTGGFDFTTNTVADTQAEAMRIETAVDFADVSSKTGKAKIYWQKREKGFSGPGQLTSEDIDQAGIDMASEITERLSIETKADRKETETQDTLTADVTGRYQVTPRWELSLGGRHDDKDSVEANASPTLSQNGARTDLAGQVTYRPAATDDTTDWQVYGFGQGTVDRTDTRTSNNRYGLGGRYKINDPMSLSGEVSGGDGGLGVKMGADWRVNERSQLYMNYTLDTDRTDHLYRGRQGKLTTGGKTRYTDSLSVYAEERLQHGQGPSGLIHAFGLDLAALDHWNFGFKGEVGDLSDPDAGDLERRAFSISAGYAKEKTRYAGNLEWRMDDGTTSGERRTWLMRNSYRHQTSPDWRIITKLNLSYSDSDTGDIHNAEFAEAVFGLAYRPVLNDKLNALIKYTYFYDLPSFAVQTPSGGMADYAQRNHIFSADAIYDLKPWLSIGGKYGFRLGELQQGRVDGPWFDSNAQLYIIRTDWHLVHNWDALIEARALNVSEAQDHRSGFLTAIYRHLNNTVKLGCGYNFTDFSDDLTDLDYNSRGWFINLVGKL